MKILKAEPGLTYPMPVEELAAALDIKEIAELETKGFEGSLLMDANTSTGIILVNKDSQGGASRWGMSWAISACPRTSPVKGNQFLCSRDDMRL